MEKDKNETIMPVGYTWCICAFCGKKKWCTTYYGVFAGKTYSYTVCDDCTREHV